MHGRELSTKREVAIAAQEGFDGVSQLAHGSVAFAGLVRGCLDADRLELGSDVQIRPSDGRSRLVPARREERSIPLLTSRQKRVEREDREEHGSQREDVRALINLPMRSASLLR